jgi:G3E family GTPase
VGEKNGKKELQKEEMQHNKQTSQVCRRKRPMQDQWQPWSGKIGKMTHTKEVKLKKRNSFGEGRKIKNITCAT